MIDTFKEISIYEAILARKSVRQYTAQKVDSKSISSLLEAAVMAPTIGQSESLSFAIVQDVQWLKAMSDVAKPMLIKALAQNDYLSETLHQSSFNMFYDASTLIVICADKDSPSLVADCWLAAENIMLAACAMGLDSCIVDTALVALNDKQGKRKLGIDDSFVAVVPIVIGFSNANKTMNKRKRPLILNWIEG